MDPLDLLRTEHELIDRIFPILEEAAWRTDHGHVLKETLPEVLDFLNNFISRCHYAREERELFPALAEAGVDIQSGVLADMLEDHNKARLIFQNLTRFAAQPQLAETGVEIAASVRVFDSLMRVHKHKEDTILFPLARETLSLMQKERIADRFAQMDAQEEPFRGSLERYSALTAKLEVDLEIII